VTDLNIWLRDLSCFQYMCRLLGGNLLLLFFKDNIVYATRLTKQEFHIVRAGKKKEVSNFAVLLKMPTLQYNFCKEVNAW
jgi:hypothetical protein